MKEETLVAAQPMTVEAYIASEERAEIRHEFINGNLIPMPGTTDYHNDICINLTHLLKSLLKKVGNFKIHQENVKVQVTSERDYTYPDVVVLSDPRDFESRYIKKYPLVLFEVMSKNSRTEDAVDKFIRYKNIASLQNYILVDSEKMLVEVRTKLENGDWESEVHLPSEGSFPIPVLGITLSFEAVYEGVALA
jgi:Uma2 family endonuclease